MGRQGVESLKGRCLPSRASSLNAPCIEDFCYGTESWTQINYAWPTIPLKSFQFEIATFFALPWYMGGFAKLIINRDSHEQCVVDYWKKVAFPRLLGKE